MHLKRNNGEESYHSGRLRQVSSLSRYEMFFISKYFAPQSRLH